MQIYYFILAVLSKAILLPITADTQDTALTIFSTLNDRGLPLSDADIFKAKIYNHLNSEEKNKFIEEWKELDENAQYAGETIQSLFYYYMFYLRAKSEDDKSTTPGIRKYFSDNKYARLFAPELLSDLSKILNIWKVVNKRDTIDNEEWSQNTKILQALDILSAYPNEFWKYAMAIASSSRKMTCCLIMDINSLTCSKPFTLPLKRITSEVKVSVFSSFVAIVALLFC